jgi:hypothetical protein
LVGWQGLAVQAALFDGFCRKCLVGFMRTPMAAAPCIHTYTRAGALPTSILLLSAAQLRVNRGTLLSFHASGRASQRLVKWLPCQAAPSPSITLRRTLGFAGCIITSVTAFTLLLLERTGSARWLEALFGAVLGVEALAMAVNFFRAGIPAGKVATGARDQAVVGGQAQGRRQEGERASWTGTQWRPAGTTHSHADLA